MTTIKIKGGNDSSLMPTLQNRELGYAYNNNGLYIGWNGSNILLNATGSSSGGSGFTSDGGLYITLINQTGASSIKGTVVSASTTTDNACMVTPSSGSSNANNKAIGVIMENGVANGSPVKVVVSGKAYVLLQDSTASTHGQWCGTSTTQNGRVIITDDPSDSTTHWREIGHCLQSVSSGINNLVLCNLHFN